MCIAFVTEYQEYIFFCSYRVNSKWGLLSEHPSCLEWYNRCWMLTYQTECQLSVEKRCQKVSLYLERMRLCSTKCRVCKISWIYRQKMNNSKQLRSSTLYCPFITQAVDSSVLPIELNLHKLHLWKCQMVYGLLLRAVTYVKIWKKKDSWMRAVDH